MSVDPCTTTPARRSMTPKTIPRKSKRTPLHSCQGQQLFWSGCKARLGWRRGRRRSTMRPRSPTVHPKSMRTRHWLPSPHTPCSRWLRCWCCSSSQSNGCGFRCWLRAFDSPLESLFAMILPSLSPEGRQRKCQRSIFVSTISPPLPGAIISLWNHLCWHDVQFL